MRQIGTSPPMRPHEESVVSTGGHIGQTSHQQEQYLPRRGHEREGAQGAGGAPVLPAAAPGATPASGRLPRSSATMARKPGRRIKRYEVFPGRNRFLCDGRLMMARQTHGFCFTCTLIIGTSTLFFIFDCPYLFSNIGRWIPVAAGGLFVFVMFSLLRTSFSDPGVLPRASPEEAEHIEKQIEVPNGENSFALRPPPRTKEVIIHGQTIKLKYCFTCKIFRPPRASHCSLCDNCVDRFDHHCPWVGNCVGRRNYRYFYLFIVSLAALCMLIFGCVITRLVLEARASESLPDTLRENPASCVECVVCFFSLWSILGLAGFHTYLTTANQTTNEDIKGSFSSRRGPDVRNPYSQGSCLANCAAVLCSPIPPSLIGRRNFVDAGGHAAVIHPLNSSTVHQSVSKNGSQHSLSGGHRHLSQTQQQQQQRDHRLLQEQQVVAGGIPLSQLDRVERMVGAGGPVGVASQSGDVRVINSAHQHHHHIHRAVGGGAAPQAHNQRGHGRATSVPPAVSWVNQRQVLPVPSGPVMGLPSQSHHIGQQDLYRNCQQQEQQQHHSQSSSQSQQFHGRAGTLPAHLHGRTSGHNPVPIAVVPPHRSAHQLSLMDSASAAAGHAVSPVLPAPGEPTSFYHATPHVEGCALPQQLHQQQQARMLSPNDYPASILKQSSV